MGLDGREEECFHQREHVWELENVMLEGDLGAA